MIEFFSHQLSSHKRYPLIPILYICIGLGFLVPQIATDFEVCNPGISEAVFQFKAEDCPYGVLFEHPIIATCMNSTSGPETFFTDLCDEENYSFNEYDVPYKIHLAFGTDNETIDPDASCAGDAPGKCNVTAFIAANPTTLTEPDSDDPCDIDQPEVALTPEEEERRKDAKVFNQTERLFKYIVGLHTDPDPEGPNLRLVKMLKQSFKILETYCDMSYVPRKFSDDVLNAFLYLLRDSDLTNFKDVSVEDYKTVMETLLQCERMPRFPFELRGKKCKTCSTVHNMEKGDHTIRYAESELSFTWGRHDVPVDATWGVLAFVHGLCYGTFRLNVNYHHLFQRVTETLFTPEVVYRWNRPPLLYYEDIWDNMFSAPVKSTMRNLDVCITAAYHNTPFLHRLERPIDDNGAPTTNNNNNAITGAQGSGKRRKRRSVTPTMSLDTDGLTGAGWCFQSKEDLLATATAYVDTHCPETRKPLNDLEEQFKTTNFIDLDNNKENAADTNGTDTSDAGDVQGGAGTE